jgi:hypothetical protein
MDFQAPAFGALGENCVLEETPAESREDDSQCLKSARFALLNEVRDQGALR